MNSSETSLRVFGYYLILIPGVGLITMPAMILGLFGLSYGPELWLPRMIGLLVSIVGAIFLLMAKYQLQVLYIWTVRLRFYAASFMVALWALHQVEIGILGFAAIDALTATWTWSTLRGKKFVAPAG